MTIQEAITLLDAADSSSLPSKINKGITRGQAVEIIRKGLTSPRALSADGINLDELFEKRVHQVSRNQIRPRY